MGLGWNRSVGMGSAPASGAVVGAPRPPLKWSPLATPKRSPLGRQSVRRGHRSAHVRARVLPDISCLVPLRPGHLALTSGACRLKLLASPVHRAESGARTGKSTLTFRDSRLTCAGSAGRLRDSTVEFRRLDRDVPGLSGDTPRLNRDARRLSRETWRFSGDTWRFKGEAPQPNGQAGRLAAVPRPTQRSWLRTPIPQLNRRSSPTNADGKGGGVTGAFACGAIRL